MVSDDGTTGGSIGIAPVSPDRLPEPLPAGLNLPVVITIQTDGATNFDVPIPATFPNVDQLPPGSKSALWSFDHDKGKWEIAGPMTVSDDGKFIATDTGVGIRQPGWHGSAPGAQIFGKGAFCGNSLEEIDQAASKATTQSMQATEKELVKVGRIASGLEESLFLADRAWPWRTTPAQFVYFGKQYIKNPSTENYTPILGLQESVRSLTFQKNNALSATELWKEQTFWDTLSTRSTIIKDAALHCAHENGTQSTKDSVNAAFTTFSAEWPKLKANIQDQLTSFDTFALSTDALNQALSAPTIDLDALSTALTTYEKDYNSLSGGKNRLDKLALRLLKSWHQFLDDSLRNNLTLYKGESFVFLKRIGSDAEEQGTPPITAQRIRVGKGGAYDAIIRPDSVYEAWMLEPGNLQIGGLLFVSPSNGGNREVAPISSLSR